MKSLILTWQNPETRSWFPVGRLDYNKKGYTFFYTKGATDAQKEGFKAFSRMEDMNTPYYSEELFPIFANRTMPKSRPEFLEYSEWFGISSDDSTLDWLAKSGGKKATDSLGVFEVPQKVNGYFEMFFFLHGIRYLEEATLDVIHTLNVGDPLFLMKDFQNHYDQNALAIRKDNPKALIGYCPRYFTGYFLKLFDKDEEPVRLSVEKVNANAPYEYKLLCKLRAHWAESFQPFSEGQFLPLVK